MPDLQVLLDERAIARVLADYCRGVDRLDVDLIRSAYHPDATDDHGLFKGSGWDFAPYVVEALRRHCEVTMHVLGTSVVDVDGHRAGGDTQVLAHHLARRDGGLVLERVGGRYVDRFERRDGGWKISDRVVVYEWSSIDPVTEEFPGTERFAQGLRSPEDLSYGVLSPTGALS